MFPLDPTPHWLEKSSYRARLLMPYVELRRWLYRRWIGSYDLVLANSHFTREWTRRFWRLDAEVLYPPVETRVDLDLEGKRPMIVSVARFFEGAHSKKHPVLIDLFKSLQHGPLSGWELHLVGGRTPVPGTDRYIDSLRERAGGAKVVFHVDASRARLENLLSSSSLFWHAAGFGAEADTRPYAREHFGISTVEAMNRGCVPLVHASGGQTEIVEDGRSGFLWRSLAELREKTLLVIGSHRLRQRLARGAHARSHRYGREAFRRHAGQLLAPLLGDTPSRSGSPSRERR